MTSPACLQQSTRNLLVAANSNRSLQDDYAGFEHGFDANGNLQRLVRGQSLSWDLRNQMSRVTTVRHQDGSDDDEIYVYDGGSQRCRKVRSARTPARTLVSEVRYLPGLEVRSEPDGELLYVCSVQAGRSSVRVLHWEQGKPAGIENDQLRYSLNDHLGSSALELDDAGLLISQEMYYPFGGTSWWAARSAVEANYKAVRYSGKKRDATGLYYYGFRYYAPWLMRWVSPDPARDIDGLNQYAFLANDPVRHIDRTGLMKMDFVELKVRFGRGKILHRGLNEISTNSPENGQRVRDALQYARKATSEAIRALTQSPLPPELDQLSERLTGTEANKAILNSIQQLNNELENFDPERLNVTKSKSPTELGFVVSDDAESRVFITELGLQQDYKVLAMTLVHELSHQKLGTVDFYYYLRGYRINPRQPVSGEEEADDVAQGRRDEKIAEMAEEHLTRQDLKDLFGGTSRAVIQQALKERPDVRAKLLLNNADTLTLLTFAYAHSAMWAQDMLASI